jgi:hypothetical protein
MLNKIPEEYTYEYIVTLEGEEIAIYYSDAVPPEIGAMLNPLEFVPEERGSEKSLRHPRPYRVIEVVHQPKNMDGPGAEVSSQTTIEVKVGQ